MGVASPGLDLTVMNMHTVRGSLESLSGRGSPSPGLSFMLSSESEACDAMDSKPQSLCSSYSGIAANGHREAKPPSNSPEIGDPRPKPPVKPKPCVLPKPAMPVKPVPGLHQTLSEVPSAEKINLLAGPKPYSSGAGGAIKRLCFSPKSSSREAADGKEVLSSFSTVVEPSENKEGAEATKRSTTVEEASREEERDSSSTHKCTIPFRVKPVPVAVKPERFPGTTVEEILAKIEKPNKESTISPDRPRLVRSFFSQDSGSAIHLGPKGYAAFRRSSSGVGGVGTDSEGPVRRVSCDVKEEKSSRNEEESRSSNEHPVPESWRSEEAVERNVGFLPVNSSDQPSVSCERDQLGQSSPPSSPGTKLFSGVIPGSPNPPAEAIQPPGAPSLPKDVPCSEALLPPGSPVVHAQPSRSPLDVSLSYRQVAGSPEAIADSWPPGSPMKTSLGHSLLSDVADVSARYPEVSLLPEDPAGLTHKSAEYNPESHHCLIGVSESPGSPSILLKCRDISDQPPGSPSCTQVSLLDQDKDSFKNQVQMLPPEDKAPQIVQRRASEGIVQPRGKKMVREELGGSLAVLPGGEALPVQQSLGGESNWSLSQSFEWSFPNRGLEFGGKKFVSPPNSPIEEDDDGNLMEAEFGRGVPQLQRLHQEAVSEEQIRREELPEAIRNSANLSYCKESEKNWRKVEGQQELHSALELSAPGGPSVDSPKLKGSVVAEEVIFQEEQDGFLHFSPAQEEGALQAMEPLPSVEQTAPPAEPCILFSEDAQVQMAVSCEQDYDALGEAQKGKMGEPDALQGVEPDPSSHWLDELLASPPPTTDGTKRSTSKVEDPTGPEDLLGWSRKDLHSEFGIVGSDCSATFGLGWADDMTKVKWPGETEQDREFSAGTRDWPNSYTVGDAKRLDMEFGTKEQEWTRGSPLLSNSSAGQEEWLTSYGNSGADQPTEKSDWSNTYSISTSECQDTEPYGRKPGWPKLCSADSDQQSSDFAVENTDWSSHYPDGAAETTHWPSKYRTENIRCPESDVSPESAKMPSKCSIESHQEMELIASHSDVSSQVSVFSASQLGWPSESDSGSGPDQLQREFSAHQVEQPRRHSQPEPQVGSQQQPQTEAYGFEDDGYQESELNVKQFDRPSRCDTGTSQSQINEFGSNNPDGATEYDSQIGQEIKTEMPPLFSLPKSEADSLAFCAQKPVWSDEYSLNEFGPQESSFPIGAGDWIRDTDFSGTEHISGTGQDLATGFGPLDFSDEKVTEDVKESADSLVHQAGNLITLIMDEPQRIREGEPEGTEDLVLGALATSCDLKVESPEAYKKPEEKQLDSIFTFDKETSSASSNTKSMNSEEARETGAGQADLIYNMDKSGTESTNVSDLSPTAVDGAEMTPKNQSYHFGVIRSDGDVMQRPGATGDRQNHVAVFPSVGNFQPSGLQLPGFSARAIMAEELREISRKCHSQRLSSPGCLLEGIISSSDGKEVAHQKRPSSFHSCHSEEERRLSNLSNELMFAAEKMRASPFPLEDKRVVLSDTDGGNSQLSSGNGSWSPIEQNGSQAAQSASHEDHISVGTGALTRENFLFLEDTEVLDSTAHRDRANLGRKRGHRAPTTRAGGTLFEDDRNSWMFRDSTEPQIVSIVSDEEIGEESKSRKPRSSPLSKGVKVPLFPGLSPSALKAKLRGRNRSVEEVDPQNETKDVVVQRSKSCKIANVSGKPLVLPPKPEKSSGSESSSPNWLQVLKLKKKKT